MDKKQKKFNQTGSKKKSYDHTLFSVQVEHSNKDNLLAITTVLQESHIKTHTQTYICQ